MRFAGASSWQVRVDQGVTELDLALWVRAVERIPIPAGGLIPGPLDLDPIPPASEPRLDVAEGIDGWASWWAQLLDVAPPNPRLVALARDPDVDLQETRFPWLLAWPDLHRVVNQRTREASRWHDDRKFVGIRDTFPPLHRHDGDVVRQLEHDLHRKAPPFVCEILVLPVLDDEIREFSPGRFLVPERVYNGPAWPATLTELVRPLFG